MEQREFIVEAEAAGQRIDRFLSGEDTGLSRSALQGLVAEGHVPVSYTHLTLPTILLV